MADRAWPPALRYGEATFQLVNTSRSGGASITGQEQVVVSPAGRWKASLSVPIAARRSEAYRDQVLAVRQLTARGRAGTILVPIRDGRGPAHRAGIVPCLSRVPHGDGTPFADGTGYAQSFSGASLASAAPVNATQVVVALGAGLVLLPGMRFSLPDGRLHEVEDILDFDGATQWTVSLNPWLRSAYDPGSVVEFENAVCRMRLASDETGALNLFLNRFATCVIDLIEAF